MTLDAPSPLADFIAGLPKCELHVHLEGTRLRHGVKVTVNSDDPAYVSGYMTENYAALADHAGLGMDDLRLLTANAFEAAWLTPKARDSFLVELDDYCHGYRR